MSKKGVIGIDLGTESIKAVALEAVPGETVPRILGVGAAPAKSMRKGSVIEPSEAASALRETMGALEKTTGIKSADIFVSFGGTGLSYQKSKGTIAISRADGEVTKEDAKRAILTSENNISRTQNREILHKIPINYRVDGEAPIHDPTGLSGVKLEVEVMFITAFIQNLKNVLKTFEEADLEVEELFPSSLAAATAILERREKEAGVILLDLGAATTSLIIFEEGIPYSLEVVPWGGSHITYDIARGLKINLDEAEKLKLNYGVVGPETANLKIYGNYSRKKLAEIIEARMADIFEYVEKHLKKVERAGLLPGGVVMTGGGANLPGIENLAKDYLNLPARVAYPENIGGFKDKIRNPAWATAVGVALMALEKRESLSPLLRGRSGSLLRWLRAFLP